MAASSRRNLDPRRTGAQRCLLKPGVGLEGRLASGGRRLGPQRYSGAVALLGGAEAAGALRLLGEVGAEVELEGGVLDGAGRHGHRLELGEL